ncbi:MAG TPA: lysylphosphatidylglycerol synthase transmembrane domain-containing protein, partial [Gaiellaceae bacterium]|nr:lysylphosphatidylglycerol synthase transmembrane domain-containing protein [Gaiellaceae bacterium]
MRGGVPGSWFVRGVIAVAMVAAVGLLLAWRGPDWGRVGDAFRAVSWKWIAVALALNVLSVVVRAWAWRTVITQALPPGQRPPFNRVFSAFAVGLLGNAVLPGRIGELARVAVLTKDMPRGKGATGRLLGSVFAHRLFDLFPALALTGFVLATAKTPRWAITSLEIAIVAGIALFLATVLVAGLERRPLPEGTRALRKLLAMARLGLNVMREPAAAVAAALLQTAGWFVQLFAVWATMFAFGLDLQMSAAALVLLLMNIATIFPLWPGNVGLLQAVVALPLVSYGVAYSTGIAFGLGLQVVEMSVGVGIGLLFLTREGMSLGTLRQMPTAEPEPEEATPPNESR